MITRCVSRIFERLGFYLVVRSERYGYLVIRWGAGSAALACLEFNRPVSNSTRKATNATFSVNGAISHLNGTNESVPLIDAYALGFGTPAILSQEISEQSRSKVTTVINDADCVPRMSGATMVNMWLEVVS
jgi:hypothetical protein